MAKFSITFHTKYHISCLIFLLLAITSCTKYQNYNELLARADSLININPDSVIQLLEPIEEKVDEMETSKKMRCLLLLTTARNKCDTVFRSDSLQIVLTNYYDHRGTPNERMIAHYLLGRAKSDMGEAPEAMRCYQEAVACADTTSFDCDWWNLTRIYLQLADEYYSSYMPMEMKEALRLSRICALHAGDTITSIIAYAKLSEVYELTDSKDSAAIAIREAAQLFENEGRHDLASQIQSLLIEYEVEKGNLEEASRIVKYYESHSGYFDDNHEIEKGREIYYYSKGLFYLGAGRPDSAECMFRKLLHRAQDMNDTHAAYLGLRKKYLATGPKDSLVKYAMLSESTNDSLYQENYKDNIQRLQSRYNYSRHLENEQRLMLSNEKRGKFIVFIIFCFIIIAATALAIYQNKRKKREIQFREYRDDLKRLRQLKAEMSELVRSKDVTINTLSHESIMQQSNIEEMKGHILQLKEKLEESRRLTLESIMAKDEEIRLLTEKNKKYDKFFINKTKDEIVKSIRKSEIVRKLEYIVSHPVHSPSAEDWDKLDQLFHEIHPNFPATLQETWQLTANEYRLCQLVFAGISPKGISVLMGFNKSNVSNMRKRLLAKLTGRNGKANEFDEFLFEIPLL